MFAKLTQTYPKQGTPQQRQQSVKDTVLNISQLVLSDVLTEIQLQYQKVQPIFIEHPQAIVQFIFKNLTIQDCLGLMSAKENTQSQKQGNVLVRLLNDIGSSVNITDHKEYIEWFSKMYTKYSGIQKVMVFLRQISVNYQHKVNDQYFPAFLADFVRASAVAIQSYLKLKAQAPKFDLDYIQHGEKIITMTEIWVRGFYVLLLRGMRVPENKPQLKQSILNGVCDIIGALMQVQRQGNIESSICDQILQQCYLYLKKVTSLAQFNQMYLNLLRQHKFNIPHHKIVLPQFYPSNLMTMPKQAYAYVIYRFLAESSHMYSDSCLFSYLIPLTNQLVQFQYEIKKKVQEMFLNLIQNQQVAVKTCFEGDIPLSVLWFNLWHYKQKRNQRFLLSIDRIYDKFKTESPKTYVNSLKTLTSFKVQDLENQINLFIGQKALQISQSNPQLLVLLIKQVNWGNLNQKGQATWANIINNMSQKQQTKTSLIMLFKTKKNKTKFQIQIEKVFSN